LTKSRYPLRINVGFLIHQPAGTFREIHFDLPEGFTCQDFYVTQLNGITRLSRTPQGILAECDFTACHPVTCSRCLEEMQQTLKTHFEELYSIDPHPTVEADFVISEDGNIDFAPILREYLLLELPISPICREDCKGLCGICGENLNLKSCVHIQQELG